MAKNIKPQEPVVGPRFLITGLKPVDILDRTVKQSDAMKANPGYATSPELQASVNAWLDDANVIASEEAAVHATRATLGLHIAARTKRVKKWKRATKRVLAQVNDLAGGDPALVKAWGFDTAVRTVTQSSEAPPEGVRVSYTKQLVMTIHWKAISGHRGYLVQIGDGTPQGWGATISAPSSKLVPTGLTAGQRISIRVAVQRKNGVSAWSDVLSVVVR